MPSLSRRVLQLGLLMLPGLCAGCTGAGGGSPTSAEGGTGACSVELWSVSWNTDGGAVGLDEDSVTQSPLLRRYRVDGCDYARSVRQWMDHASPLGPSPAPSGDIRLLARVTTGNSSWLLAIPITCNWVRLDRARSYRFDPELFALLARPLADDERIAVQRFGACGL